MLVVIDGILVSRPMMRMTMKMTMMIMATMMMIMTTMMMSTMTADDYEARPVVIDGILVGFG